MRLDGGQRFKVFARNDISVSVNMIGYNFEELVEIVGHIKHEQFRMLDLNSMRHSHRFAQHFQWLNITRITNWLQLYKQMSTLYTIENTE